MHDCRQHGFSRSNFLAGTAAAATMLLSGGRAIAQSPPPAAPQHNLIDVHHHYYPPELLAAMSAWSTKHKQPQSPAMIANWGIDHALAEMDANGVAVAILSLSSMQGVWFGADPATIPALSRSCNDFVAKAMHDHPGRFGNFATLPMPDVAASLKEITYAFDTLHADGIGLPTSFGDRWPGDAAFEPLWHELNRRKAMVVFHPYAPNCCATLQPGIAESYLEYPYDTGRAFLSLLFSGMLEKYQDIRWTFSHGGGTIPYLVGRVTNLAANQHQKLDVVAPDGIEAVVQRMYFDTANATYGPTWAALAEEMPISQLLFGTDYPYVTTKQNVDPLLTDGLSAADLAAVERGNAIRLIPRLKALVPTT